MKTLRRHFVACSVLALLAALTLALLPTVSHALGLVSAPDGGRAEVCTPKGVVFVALNGGDLVPAALEGSDDHVGCCTGATLASWTLPPAAPAWGPDAVLLPAPAACPGSSGPQWGCGQPRAPPFST